MARESANYTTFYRVVVEREYYDGATTSAYLGPYATLGVARSMLSRNKLSPAHEGYFYRRVTASRIESITGEWKPIDAE